MNIFINTLKQEHILEMLDVIKEQTGIYNDDWFLVSIEKNEIFFYNIKEKMEFIFNPIYNHNNDGKRHYNFSFQKPKIN